MTSVVATSSQNSINKPTSPEALPSLTTQITGNNPGFGNGDSLGLESTKRASIGGFLRRSKSTEPLSERKSSTGKMSKKMREQAREEELRRQREAVPQQPPRLPDLEPSPQLKTFGGEGNPENNASQNSQSVRASSQPPVPPIPPVDPYARTESMTHRGRYSYASSLVSTINNPRRLRRRKDPTPYNLLVVGARNSGKTSFLDFLRKSLALPPNKQPIRSPDEFEEPVDSTNSNFVSHYLETEIEGERVGLTLWDSEGLEKSVVDLQLREITAFLESKFEDTFNEEMKVVRSPGTRDTHIHCVFLILDPVRLDSNIAAARKAANGKPGSRVIGVLDEDLDLSIFRTMQGKTTVVPIISKADTITTRHMAYLKKAVWESLKQANINPLEVLTLEEQEAAWEEEEEEEDGEEETEKATEDSDSSHDKLPIQKPDVETPSGNDPSSAGAEKAGSENFLVPLSILSPDPHTLDSPNIPIGRHFPWGFADPYNPEHCDVVKLREFVFREWRSMLREASREVWYERWRTNRLNRQGLSSQVRKQSYMGRSGPPLRSGRSIR